MNAIGSILACLCCGAPPAPAHPAAGPAGASRVCRIAIPRLVEGRWDLEVILYHRAGAFHHGYARLPKRDNLPHRVCVRPPKPFIFVDKAGAPIDVPEKARGYYSYKNADFLRFRALYAKGEIRIIHPDPPAPIAWDGNGLHGVVDVLVLGLDEANTPGRNRHSIAYRIRLDGEATGGAIAGRFAAWTYAAMDDRFGAGAPRLEGRFTARWHDGFWRPGPGTAYAPGKDWPQVRGPDLNGSAVPTAAELVANLHDARLLWVAEERIGGGRSGQVQRGDFQMYPAAWTNAHAGGFGGPAVAGGRVYLYVLEADRERLAADPRVRDSPYVRVGADPGVLANKLGCLRDAVLCFDARTGRTLWHFRSDRTFGRVPEGKGGRGSTPCVAGGRVFARGAGGLYALDRETGELLWLARDKRVNLTLSSGAAGTGGWSRDVSPVWIGGTLLLADGGALVGIDPDAGRIRWKVEKAIGHNAVPAKVVLGGKAYAVTASRLFKPGEKDRKRGATDSPERLLLVDPATGAVIWESDALGSSPGSLCAWGDLVCGNGVRGLLGPDAADGYRLAGARVSLAGAERLWLCEAVHYQQARATQIASAGYVYVDSRRTGFACVNMRTGAVVGAHPHIYLLSGGSHNWTWHVATNDRILTSGILMFTDGPRGFRLLPGRLSVPLASGYTCPVKPAVADGRLFVRTGDSLVCYDLRRPPGAGRTEILPLRAAGAFAGLLEDEDDAVAIRIRARDGRLLELAARWPTRWTHRARTAVPWIRPESRAPWKASIPDGLAWTGTHLRGETDVRIGFHRERWTFDLACEDGRLRGTYRRRIPAPGAPIPVGGAVDGALARAEPGGAATWTLHLQGAAGRLPALRDPRAERRPVALVLAVRDGRIRSAFAAAQGLNGAAHEVDPSGLTAGGARLAGRVVVVFHDDAYFDLDGARALREGRRAGAGRAIAAAYRIEARADAGGPVSGRYRGSVGVEWARTGAVTGAVAPEGAP